MPLTRVAACHVAPHFLSAKNTLSKSIHLIHQASKNSANLVVFPETFISAFPVWSALRPPTENHGLFERMTKESIYVDGEEVQQLRDTARDTNTVISIGISERSRSSTACLYNSNLIIGPTGDILVHHRKLMPTFFEKLVWSPGDGHGLRVAETPFGKIGNLICGENTNPLARYSLMGQGEQIHISSWPPVWPTRAQAGVEPQAGHETPANYDNIWANRVRAAAHCFEAKCFGVMCSGFLTQNMIEALVDGASSPASVRQTLESTSQGVTMFLDPAGASLPSFVVDEAGSRKPVEFLQKEEDILYTDMDLDRCIEGKQYHDVVGGYQRLDVFNLQVNRARRDPVTFVDDAFVRE
ncbi:uncharacterized protein N7506_007206 [Penicillium brevicompactum]|uniref:uncharacterized protein n=1 Tax=Penicillium brevicompactum TaxID=5074 RepID=UPI0025425066|nr:uncharacterized protein N7506_007206 [Penicillium brevicompactum]KAJ5333423.1 hypothetical protein N7506_007206 [Penicillium brevicompactum]